MSKAKKAPSQQGQEPKWRQEPGGEEGSGRERLEEKALVHAGALVPPYTHGIGLPSSGHIWTQLRLRR